MRLRFLLSATILSSCLLAMPAAAQQVSVYKRDGYDRLVIDGIGISNTARGQDNIIFTLSKSLPDTTGQGIEQTIKNQSAAVDTVTVTDGQLTLGFADAVTSSRYFNIADRLIVDIFTSGQAQPETPAETSPVETIIPEPETQQDIPVEQPTATEETPEPEPAPLITEVDETPPVDPTDISDLVEHIETPPVIEDDPETSLSRLLADTDVTEPAPIVPELPEINESLIDPTIISLSSATPIGLAAFERFDRLFIVIDRQSLALPPQMTGTGAREGWNIREIPMDNETAWVIDLPKNAQIRPESDGLLWRLVVSNIDPQLQSVDVRRGMAGEHGAAVDIMLQNTSRVLRLTDPDYGDDLAVILMPNEKQRLAQSYDFIDFDILPAVVGGVVKPETDGVRITATPERVSIGKRGGLNVAAVPQDEYVEQFLRTMGGQDVARRDLSGDARASFNRIYYFNDWGANIPQSAFLDKRVQLDRLLAQSVSSQKVPVLLDLAKLHLSHAMGAEALGYLRLAKDSDPRLADTPEYLSLLGAAHFLARQYDRAIAVFDHPSLAYMPEIQLWKSSAIAANGTGDDGTSIYPGNADIIASYPPAIGAQIVGPLATSFLDVGNADQAEILVEKMGDNTSRLNHENRATLAYLKGRIEKATGRPDDAVKSLYEASFGDKLGPYGARSELLLVEDELLREVITREEAIKRLERLRFSWRGDSLETEIYKALGQLYIADGQPRRGMTILKTAAENTRSVADRRSLVRTMADTYKAMFLEENFDKLDPLEAVTVYREFKELTPAGDEGNRIIDRIADKLVEIDLLDRAASLLKDKMQRLGGGEEAVRTGLRVAAIELVDRKSADALRTLSTVDGYLRRDVNANKREYNEKSIMLKARALSEQGQADRALFMLEGMPNSDDVLRLRVDTAWRDGNWAGVSQNLALLIANENLTPDVPPTEKQARMILNQAVALSLSDQRTALQNFAAEYNTMMQQTPLYRTFRLVSRPSGMATLADRDTMMSLVSEVDMFQEFLDSNKSAPQPQADPAQ